MADPGKLIDADALVARLDSMMSESSNAVSLSAIIALAVVKGTLIPDMPDASESPRARIAELEARVAEIESELDNERNLTASYRDELDGLYGE